MPKPIDLGHFKSQRLRASEMSDLLARQNAAYLDLFAGLVAALIAFSITFYATHQAAIELQLPV